MKVLWLCNIVLPEFAKEFALKPTIIEGWLTGMLHQMEKRVKIALCFPIIDSWRKKDGELNGHPYYSFTYSDCEYRVEVEERFIEIINEYQPDIIHIWGTEFPHTLAMINASEKKGLLDRVIVNIQGLVEPCSLYYLDHIPEIYLDRKNECDDSLRKAQEKFRICGIFERNALHKVKYVIGRTDWDCAWVKHVNLNIIYYCVGEILRDEFYEVKRKWSHEMCEKHSIFVSQAGYAIKGLDYLLRAMPDIMKDYPDVHIYIAGTNPMVENPRTGFITPYGIFLKDIIEELNLQDNVTFLGRLNAEQMIQMYLRANVFVSCSRIENSPNSVCEAAFMGTPIVASYVGGISNLAKKISSIYLYQPGAEYMLAFYIKEVFAKDTFEPSSNEIADFMDRRKNTEYTLQIYRNLINSGKA